MKSLDQFSNKLWMANIFPLGQHWEFFNFFYGCLLFQLSDYHFSQGIAINK